MFRLIKRAFEVIFLLWLDFVLKLAFFLRYDIEVKGLEKLTKENLNKPGGIIFLPNHVAIVLDSVLVIQQIWLKFYVRPMIVEYMFKNPIYRLVFNCLKSISVPNFDTGTNSYKKKKLMKAFDSLLEDLKNGENFVIYPGARLKSGAKEIIRSSGVYHILRKVPETNVVFVRITGLWGSEFSKAITGKMPNPEKVILRHWKDILKNMIFFMPRRKVTIDFEPQKADFPWKGSVDELNKYIENQLNTPDGLSEQKGEYPGDTLNLVSYSIWENKVPQLNTKVLDTQISFDLRNVPDYIKDKVTNKLASISGWNSNEITPDKKIFDDLGLDSIDAAELIVYLQDEFHVPYVPLNHNTRVMTIMGIASHEPALLEHKNPITVKKYHLWENEVIRKKILLLSGKSIPEIFFQQCDRIGSQIACVDIYMGVLTYNDIKLRILHIYNQIKKLPGDTIGILLPAGPSIYILTLALQLAKKTPLIINWVLGSGHIHSVIELSKPGVIISLWNFIDQLDNVDFNGADEKFLFLDDIYRNLDIIDKLNAKRLFKKNSSELMNTLCDDSLTDHDTAVLVFTSGTEGDPKGVPLTHHNILSNIRDFLAVFDFYTYDVILDVLPPFHSIGYAFGGLLGLLSGIKVAFSPTLNDGYQMALDIESWRVTTIFSLPTFLKVLFQTATCEQLKSLRLCVTGMEKASSYLLNLMKKCEKAHTLVEAYGLSEATGILTANRLGQAHKGVGRTLPCVDLTIIHPESHQPLPIGELGLVAVKGPNIFKGYLNPDLSSPFIEINGEKWFVTGDLGYLNYKNQLTVTDRMRRYIHIGGEIISLHLIEEALNEYAKEQHRSTTDMEPTMAVIADEQIGVRPKIYLFTRFDINVIEVNKVLRKAGFSSLAKVVSVKKIEKIPLLPTGQTNYLALRHELPS